MLYKKICVLYGLDNITLVELVFSFLLTSKAYNKLTHMSWEGAGKGTSRL